MTRSLAPALLRSTVVALTAVLSLAASPATGHAQGWHQDQRYGFKLMPPKGWKPIPLKAEENWLLAKFLCDEKDFWTSKQDGWTWEHQPELMVIAFVAEAIAKAEQVTELEDEDGTKAKVVVKTRPYKDYEDFLDRTYSGGGFYVSSREEGVSNDLPVTKIEVKVEKLVSSGPKRIVTWVFHAAGVDLAVQTEVLEDEYPKRKATINGVLRSFRSIPRTMGPLPTDASTDEGFFISFLSMKKGTPEERRQKRLESEVQLHARARKSLPAGWQAKDHARFLVLFDTDVGFADKVAESGDALLAWAEAELGFIGKDEYVRRPILRICASREEKESLQRGVRNSESWSFDSGNEIVTCKDEYGTVGWQMDQLNRELIDLWMRDRDEDVWLGMPEWIQHGLYEYVAGARVSGRKLQFKDYFREVQQFREVVQEEKHIPVRALVQMSQVDFYGADNDWAGVFDRMAQADMVVRFLLSSEAGRSKQTKTLLFDYIRHLREVVLELESAGGEEEEEEAAKEPTTEEEEEELYKKKHEAWGTSEREKQVLERTFQRAFAGWSDKDWDSFERAFLKYAN